MAGRQAGGRNRRHYIAPLSQGRVDFPKYRPLETRTALGIAASGSCVTPRWQIDREFGLRLEEHAVWLCLLGERNKAELIEQATAGGEHSALSSDIEPAGHDNRGKRIRR
jgi:hypothetical protein